MGTVPFASRLLAGPPPGAGHERLADHVARLGPRPDGRDDDALIASLDASGLLGRGGAGFPVGKKWRSIADRSGGRAVVVANGAEGEPLSAKDRVLMAHRPHLVLDGAVLAAETVGAEEIIVYVGEEHEAAHTALRHAIAERGPENRLPIRVLPAPMGYVSGEASAAVHYINERDPRPTTSPPRPSEHGVRGRPTLVQNVESLAYAALIARFGPWWYRSAGRGESRGTALVTVSGAGAEGVREIELGSTVGEVAVAAGIREDSIGAVLMGGYFGAWAPIDEAWDLELDPTAMRARGLAFGCGLLGFLPTDTCGVSVAADVMSFMAAGSAGQCGPCVYGLGAIAGTSGGLANGTAGMAELAHLERWTGQLAGRGACRHPDGAAEFMASALAVFGDEFVHHARTGRCGITGSRLDAA